MSFKIKYFRKRHILFCHTAGVSNSVLPGIVGSPIPLDLSKRAGVDGLWEL